jgi:hypothetical protein
MKLVTLLLSIFALNYCNQINAQGFTKEREKFIKEWQKLVSEPDAVFFCKDGRPQS